VAKKGHTEEQILRELHQTEGGVKMADICRKHGVELTRFGGRCLGERKREECNAKNPSTVRAGIPAPSH
jgi:hypothetical protein